jgi:lipid-A-disaccharide synthase
LKLGIPAAKHLVEAIEEEVKTWPNTPVVIDPRKDEDGIAKRAAFKAADVALAASGTVSLELAAAETPMVIAYDMGWLSRQIIGRMLLVDTVTLVNLVSESRVVPEFINKDCEPLPIARAIEDVLDNPDAQNEAMALTMQPLGQGRDHPGLRAARAVLARLPASNTQH